MGKLTFINYKKKNERKEGNYLLFKVCAFQTTENLNSPQDGITTTGPQEIVLEEFYETDIRFETIIWFLSNLAAIWRARWNIGNSLIVSLINLH